MAERPILHDPYVALNYVLERNAECVELLELIRDTTKDASTKRLASGGIERMK